MTEETQEQSRLYTYYWSTDDEPCKAYYTLTPLASVSWPLVEEAPDMTKLKSPKYDWQEHHWTENDQTAQGAQIATLTKSIETLQKSNKELAQDKAQTDTTLESIQKQNAQMLTMLSAALAPKTPASNTPNSAAQTSESTATSESVKGSAE